MKLQEIIYQAEAARGYTDGYTDEQFALRQVVKAVEELAELTATIWNLWGNQDIQLPYEIINLFVLLQSAGETARNIFDDKELEWPNGLKATPQLKKETADVGIVLNCLAESLKFDLEDIMRKKVVSDVKRGRRS